MASRLLIPVRLGATSAADDKAFDLTGWEHPRRWASDSGKGLTKPKKTMEIAEKKAKRKESTSGEEPGSDPMRTNLATVLDPNRSSNDAGELDAALRRRIVGQEQAVENGVEIYQMFLAGPYAPARPARNPIFPCPTAP